MKTVVGVVGAAGDLGSQLRSRLQAHGHRVLACDIRLEQSLDLATIAEKADIVHVCAPLENLRGMPAFRMGAMVVLHDSVMSTSRKFSDRELGGGAAVVHMLLNSHDTAVVASDAPYARDAVRHLEDIGCKVASMTVDDHDRLMARSQAPLALLMQTLLPELEKNKTAGLLTNSGEYLVDVLHARQAAWTPATVHAILQNPQLSAMVGDLKDTLEKVGYNKEND